MITLTRAELAHYPGQTATDQAPSRHAEAPGPAGGEKRPSRAGPVASSLPRRIDLRPFPGRDRTERVMGWLISNIPRASTWSLESLREVAAQLAATADTVE